jgi:hypothetical protein
MIGRTQDAIKAKEDEVKKARALKDAAEAARAEAEAKVVKAQRDFEAAHARAHPVIDVAAVAAKAKAVLEEEQKKQAEPPKEPEKAPAKKKRAASPLSPRGGRSSRWGALNEVSSCVQR